jgi:hypothetical protein
MNYNFTPLQETWLNALETGRFRKGRERLATRNIKHKTVNYCCLGVACVVARENKIKVSKVMSVSDTLLYILTVGEILYHIQFKLRLT